MEQFPGRGSSYGRNAPLAGPAKLPPYKPIPYKDMYAPPHVPQYQQRMTPHTPCFRYDSSSALFAGDWGIGNFVAVGSYSETNTNGICVLRAQTTAKPPSFSQVGAAKTKYPPTKLSWEPFTTSAYPKLLSSGDLLRLWEVSDSGLAEIVSLSKRSKSHSASAAAPSAPGMRVGADNVAPLTSFQWSSVNSATVITSSIDTTCTVWDLNSQTVTTQLIAHDQEVFDVAFLHNGTTNQFVSVGADGSARLFDLRSLDNSTIIYETEPATPLLRVAPSPYDANLVCTFGQDQSSIAVLDLRATRNPVSVLEGHQAPVNSIRWLPDSRNLLASGADDCQILIWNMSKGDVVGCYNESRQINNVLASPDGEWLGSVHGKCLQAISTRAT